ncbi:MAG: hypothetical protein DYH01_01720 [Chlorobi bacterium CHB7]|nr:hypothetical protein [Chlorobi bacterium CHB7]OQY77450.1 MAG: hypothetical protein B6D43_07495 [Ignavibacteriales bacterium UTCHB1]
MFGVFDITSSINSRIGFGRVDLKYSIKADITARVSSSVFPAFSEINFTIASMKIFDFFVKV